MVYIWIFWVFGFGVGNLVVYKINLELEEWCERIRVRRRKWKKRKKKGRKGEREEGFSFILLGKNIVKGNK